MADPKTPTPKPLTEHIVISINTAEPDPLPEKKRTRRSKAKAPPTVADLIEQLTAAGGLAKPWYDIPAARHLKTLQAALDQKLVFLGLGGELKLIMEESHHGSES